MGPRRHRRQGFYRKSFGSHDRQVETPADATQEALKLLARLGDQADFLTLATVTAGSEHSARSERCLPRGFFTSGKFDLRVKGIPYSTLAQAFQGPIRQVLSGGEEDIGRWRRHSGSGQQARHSLD